MKRIFTAIGLITSGMILMVLVDEFIREWELRRWQDENESE